jgi:hypothetical protein
MFAAIFVGDNAKLLQLAREFHRRLRPNHMAALLCFDHALSEPPRMHNDNAQIVSRHLEDYDSYAQLMRKVIIDWRKAQAAIILGFIEADDESVAGTPEELHVFPTSVLYEPLRNGHATIQSTDEYITINPRRLSEVIREVLGRRMKERLVAEHDICLQAKAFHPCLTFAAFGTCRRVACFRDHLPRELLDVEAFNLRVRLHMQQILIVHDMGMLVDNSARRSMQR